MAASEASDSRRKRETAVAAEQPRPAEPDLRAALRQARVDEAERSRAIGDLHAVEVARLEVLRDRLEPLAKSLPADADLFDLAVVPSPRPRLFIDMIGLVEMAADRRRYRLVQDTREGRLVLHEGEGLDSAVEAVTAYVARRLIEREKMLASAHAPRAPRHSRLSMLGRLTLEYLGVVSLVVLLWVLGQAVFRWAARL